jgi:hypothetical protein
MTVPSLVRNSYTAVQRSNFATLNSAWNTLTDAQRALWLAVDGLQSTDRFGNPIVVTGKALYVMLNRALANVGVAALGSPPSFTGATAVATAVNAAGIAAGIFKITFTVTPVPANTAYVFFGTAPQTAGTSRPGQSKFRLIGIADAASASPKNLSAEYTVKYGVPAVGTKIFLQAIAVNKLTGQQSVPLQTVATVVA